MKSVQIQSFSWSVFSRIRTEYGEIQKCPNTEFFLVRIFPHSDWIQNRKDSVFGHFLRSGNSNSTNHSKSKPNKNWNWTQSRQRLRLKYVLWIWIRKQITFDQYLTLLNRSLGSPVKTVLSYLPPINAKVNEFTTTLRYLRYLLGLTTTANMP